VTDAHVHIWDLPDPVETPFPYHPATLESLLANMNAAGVVCAVLVQPGVYQTDHTYLRTAVAAYPDRFAAVALIDPFDPHAPSMLEELAGTIPLRGIRFRLKDQTATEANTSSKVHDLLDRIEHLNLTLSILTSPPGLDAIQLIAHRHPDLHIVVDHLGSPNRSALADNTYLRSLRDLQQTPNIWLKLSGFYSFSSEPHPYLDCQPLARHLLHSFGAHRLIWGSDFPFSCAQHTYQECVEQLSLLLPELAETEADQLLSANASTLWPGSLPIT
jgi:L-fuconolactonase